MGMYTEFIFGCGLSKDTPRICIEALDYVINGQDKQSKYENPEDYTQKCYNDNYIDRTLPIDEIEAFINKYDFYRLFQSFSYYFGAANPIGKFYWDNISNTYRISTRANLKNYSNQIETFIDYIKKYVTQGSGCDHNIFAYVQYEEDPFPTIYAMDDVYNMPELENSEEYCQK